MKRRPTPVTHPTLLNGEVESAFAAGFAPEKGKAILPIPREEWPAEIARANAEEREWWQGSLVPIHLAVELPFWLMIPDGSISVTHAGITLKAAVCGRFLEVSQGPMFLNSHANVVVIGPGDELWQRPFSPSILPSQIPVYRPMKTVIVFPAQAMEDAFSAWVSRATVAQGDRRGIRRVNRGIKYFQSLATGHIPFLNRLIKSYRSASFDPYAFEVSEWDVPMWYARRDDVLVPISLMRYWDSDTYPSLNQGGVETPYFAATLEAVHSQMASDVAPGKLELLDAYSLMFRGRFGDAVRSAVTAIEVALEAQLTSLLHQAGYTPEQAAERLSETRSSFFERLAEYERLSQKRVPGPLLSSIPYINGIRLRSELDWVRALRHKVVHEGIRVDVSSRGSALRAVETMSWLFDWLSWEDAHGPEDNTNYNWFSFLRGQLEYPVQYSVDGVLVQPLPLPAEGEPIITDDEAILEQYLATTEGNGGDIELLARMSFEYLGLACDDGPPEPRDEPKLRERFIIGDGKREAIVFCIESDGLLDTATANEIVGRTRVHAQLTGKSINSLVIVHHQRHVPRELRVIEDVIPADVQLILDSNGTTTLSALDLQLLVRATIELGWCRIAAKEILFAPGRQGLTPPAHHKIGVVNRYYPRHSAISARIGRDMNLRIGDTICIRLASRFVEEVVASLQVERASVTTATGPCNVGIGTRVSGSEFREGQAVFVRTR